MTRRREDALISRRNWQATRSYMAYCREVRQCSESSVEIYRVALDLMLRWARETPLSRAPQIRPVFPQYLESEELSESYRKKTCATVRGFYVWAVGRWPDWHATVSGEWIESLKPARGQQSVRERELYTVEDVRALVAVPAQRLADERDRAAVAFMFLSGMRNAAFCSLPVRAVDLSVAPGTVRQWPSLGVRTKNSKAANTYLLNVPDLLAVVQEWDEVVRTSLGLNGLWYAPVTADGMGFDPEQTAGEHRSLTVRLPALCRRAGIPYRSAHKFRHGHAVWALQHAEGLGDLKAISQNLMHASLTTTDKVYGALVGDDVQQRIAALSEAEQVGMPADAAALAEQLFRMLKAR